MKSNLTVSFELEHDGTIPTAMELTHRLAVDLARALDLPVDYAIRSGRTVATGGLDAAGGSVTATLVSAAISRGSRGYPYPSVAPLLIPTRADPTLCACDPATGIFAHPADDGGRCSGLRP